VIDDETKSTLERLQAETKTLRKTRFRKSGLDKVGGELIKLHKAGATKAELKRWLKSQNIIVAWSTVHRWIEKNS
jgi:hypothetical protein